jgi:hypothetical protein
VARDKRIGLFSGEQGMMTVCKNDVGKKYIRKGRKVKEGNGKVMRRGFLGKGESRGK